MCVHDTLAVVNILPPAERSSVFGGATWQLTTDHQLFAQYLYSYDRYFIIRNTAPTSQDANPDSADALSCRRTVSIRLNSRQCTGSPAISICTTGRRHWVPSRTDCRPTQTTGLRRTRCGRGLELRRCVDLQ
jgi:hypothetical protein